MTNNDRTNEELIAEVRARGNAAPFVARALAARLEAATRPVLVCSDCGQPSGRDRGHVDDAAFKRCLDRERLARERDAAIASVATLREALEGIALRVFGESRSVIADIARAALRDTEAK